MCPSSYEKVLDAEEGEKPSSRLNLVFQESGFGTPHAVEIRLQQAASWSILLEHREAYNRRK